MNGTCKCKRNFGCIWLLILSLRTLSQLLEPGSSVSIVYGYGLDDWAIEV
jgi:hypothetical protein